MNHVQHDRELHKLNHIKPPLNRQHDELAELAGFQGIIE